jgi:dihydroneopterin aldolase
VISFVEASSFLLLERLADGLVEICLKSYGVEAATVTIDKPGALPAARSAAVEIRREG